MNNTPNARPGARASSQRGLSLLFALLALVALSLAAAGLVRTVGGGSLAVGNLGFKLDATANADLGAEQAITWLQTNLTGSTLEGNVSNRGYYATSTDALDPTGRNTAAATRVLVDWDNDNCANGGVFSGCLDAWPSVPAGTAGVNWIITRLCATTGSTGGANSCATSLTSGATDDPESGSREYGNEDLGATTSSPYYRIVVRSVGARNTVSYTETIVRF